MVVVWSSSAKQDLAYILEDISDNFGSKVAKKVRDRLFAHVNLLGIFTRMGVKVKDISSEVEVRYLINTPNLIFYSVDETSVNIISIFDHRMSPDGIKQNLQKRLIRKV